MQGTIGDQMGYIVFTQNVKPTPLALVKEAAFKSGLPEKLIKDIRPWNAFKRAMAHLMDKGVVKKGDRGLIRDKIEDTNTKLAFQFVGQQERDFDLGKRLRDRFGA